MGAQITYHLRKTSKERMKEVFFISDCLARLACEFQHLHVLYFKRHVKNTAKILCLYINAPFVRWVK